MPGIERYMAILPHAPLRRARGRLGSLTCARTTKAASGTVQRIEYNQRMLENQKLLREAAEKRLRNQQNDHFKVRGEHAFVSAALVCIA